MKTLKKLAVVLVATMMLVAMTACGTKTLEDYKSTDDWTKIEKEAASMGGNGISLEVDAKGNTLIYVCTFEDGMLGEDPDYEALGEQLDSAISANEDQFKSIIEAAEDDLKIKGVSVEIIYKADGKTLLDKTIK